MAELDLFVNIFIRQVYAAVKSSVAVYDQDFPMVTVVIVGGDEGGYGSEDFASDSQGF